MAATYIKKIIIIATVLNIKQRLIPGEVWAREPQTILKINNSFSSSVKTLKFGDFSKKSSGGGSPHLCPCQPANN